MIDFDAIINEWSYRTHRGYPIWNDPRDMIILKDILKEMNLSLDAIQLKESEFTPSELVRDKYLNGFIDKITKGEPFILEKDKEKVIIDPKFLDVLTQIASIQSISDRQNAIKKQFGTNAIIPLEDGRNVRLKDISKDTFTAKSTTSGLVGTETPDFKEGLVVYFYDCSKNLLDDVFDYIKGNNTKIPELSTTSINASHYGDKSAKLVTSGIDLLTSGATLDVKTKQLFLNAISAAKTIQKNFGLGYVIDRGDLFNDIRKAAKKITNVPEDKWCPGDVYLYKNSSIGVIKDIIKQSVTSNSIVSIEGKGGDVFQVGLNSLFDIDNPLVTAVSLKEEEALSGRAKDFVSVKNLKGVDLGAETGDFTKDEMALLTGRESIDSEVIDKYRTEYNVYKLKYSREITKFGYKNTFGTSKYKEPEVQVEVRNKIVKSAIYRLLNRYFANFDTLKGINDVMKNYDDPFLALTAYGVSLSGFNPTFYKVVASSKGDYGHVTVFKGRDSLKAESDSVITIDTPTKAGVYLTFKTIMGDKMYQTKLDVREAKSGSSISIAIIVDEFKEA